MIKLLTILLILFAAITVNAATITVPAGGNVQAAIDAAQPGDTIILIAGVQYPANLTIPNKALSADIIVQSSRAAELPAGMRVAPAQSSLLAKLVSVVPAEPIIKTAAGAHNFRFIGVQIMTANQDLVVYDLVRFGEGRDKQNTLAQVPNNLSIDRSIITGWPTQDVQRGVAMNCSECEVINSSILDVHMVGIEAQGIVSWNGPGPFRVINNEIQASTQGILFGGADPASEAFTPSNITVAQNHLFKPLTWKVGDPSYAGKHWTVKNIIEFKNAKNATVVGNLFENNWTDGQDGTAILFTVRNQECSAPFATVQKISFTNNILRNAEGAFNFLGKDNEAEPTYQDRLGHVKCSDPGETFGSVRGSGVVLRNNLVYNISGKFIVINGFDDVTFERNTHIQKFNTMELYGEQSSQFIYRDNVTPEENYGIHGDGGTQGQSALDKFAPGAIVTGNVVAHPYQPWPDGNQIVASLMIDGEFRTPYVGKGADIDAVNAAQGGAGTSLPTPSPTPSVSPSPTATPTPVATPTPTPTATPTPLPSPSPSPVRTVYEVSFPKATSDSQRQSITTTMAAQGWVCQPNPGGNFLICHRVKM